MHMRNGLNASAFPLGNGWEQWVLQMEDGGKSGFNPFLDLESLLCSTEQQGFATQQASSARQQLNPSAQHKLPSYFST